MKDSTKLHIAVTFLQFVLMLVGGGSFVFLLWEPQGEGVNLGKTLFQIYFTDLFLVYVYVSSIPFFAVIYSGIKILTEIKNNSPYKDIFRRLAVTQKLLLLVIVCVFFGEIIIRLSPSDDRAGGTFMGILVTLLAFCCIAGIELFRNILNKNHRID